MVFINEKTSGASGDEKTSADQRPDIERNVTRHHWREAPRQSTQSMLEIPQRTFTAERAALHRHSGARIIDIPQRPNQDKFIPPRRARTQSFDQFIAPRRARTQSIDQFIVPGIFLTQLDFSSIVVSHIFALFPMIYPNDVESFLSFQSFILHVINTSALPFAIFVGAVLLLTRLAVENPGLNAKRGSEYRLFTVSSILANKMLSDFNYSNAWWATASGLPLLEINVMEREFLRMLRYNVTVHSPEYFEFVSWNVVK